MNATEKELIQVNEVGPRIAKSIAEFFLEPQNRKLVEQLRAAGLNLVGHKKLRGTQLAGKSPIQVHVRFYSRRSGLTR